ncbi:pregnancy-specific beta-1-glycoprotein 3-like [Xenia sp. Carnegie-2017]|uniref:pregnancy-specific beta-1-glycoprotein 3-like n=1 Tax=Xenia sp. Carnegie-2017 TaxID=2897299 RepID=UPI001F034FB6|nr:pregnancy-specific beta-1-glycoprotein 3-like [Xenia sp. Carnegie-2017]
MATLIFPQVDRNSNGQYRCEAKSHEKAKKKTIELIINYKPVNVKLTIKTKSFKTTWTCTAEGNPPPRYEIFFNDSISVGNGSTLVLYEVTLNPVGFYTCRATNVLGGMTSSEVYPSLEGSQ